MGKENNIRGRRLERYSHAGNPQKKNCQRFNIIVHFWSHLKIVPIRLLSRTNPVTRLRADLPTEPTLRQHHTATYHRQTDSAAMPAITILIAPLRLQYDQIIAPTHLLSQPDNNRANMHMIHRPTDRCSGLDDIFIHCFLMIYSFIRSDND